MSAAPKRQSPGSEHVYRAVSSVRAVCLLCEVWVTRGMEKHHEVRHPENHPATGGKPTPPVKPPTRVPRRASGPPRS